MGLFTDPAEKAQREELHALCEEFRALRGADAERLDRYARYRAENNEARDFDLDTYIGTGAQPVRPRGTGADYGRRRGRGAADVQQTRQRIPVPLGRATQIKHAYRIAGQLPDVVVDRRAETPQERHRSDTMEKIVWSIHRASDGDAEFAAAALDGSEVGASCFVWDFSIDTQTPTFCSVDPATVLVVRGALKAHEFQRVYRFWRAPLASVIAEYRRGTFRGQPVDVDELAKVADKQKLAFITIVEMCDGDRYTRFCFEAKVGLWEHEHTFGFAPYVVIPNLGPEREVWGWSDYEMIRALNRYLSVSQGREADLLRAVANGAMQMTGSGKATPATVETVLRNGGVVHNGREGKIEPIDVPQVPSFAEAHVSRILELVKMVGFAPDAAWGLGAGTSGSDRGLQLQPLLEYTAMKQLNWAAGLARLYAMGFKIIEGKTAGSGGRYSGVARGKPFSLQIGPDVRPLEIDNPEFAAEVDDETGTTVNEDDAVIQLPRTPRELFDGDYRVRFTWANRVDPDDPAFVASELNKFVQGAQSLERTLDRLGIEAPEDEMKRIEEEAERFPWLRNGMIALIKAQLQMDAARENAGAGQGEGGGRPVDPGENLMAGLESFAADDSAANDADRGFGSLPGGSGVSALYGQG